MPNKTTNYGLIKPLAIENYDVDDQNGNMDLIDKGLVMYGGTTSGEANAYAISSPVITDLKEGMAVSVKIHAASTDASTLNWCGLGAKAIKKADGSNVTNLKINGIYTLRYDGTNFILQGEGASGNATASDLLSGKTATTDAGEITGTMPNIGPELADTIELNTQNQEYIIPLGRHSGLRKIKTAITNLVASVIKAGATVGGIPGTFTNDATATASQMLSGATAWVKGVLVTGNIASKAAQTYGPSTSAQNIAAGQYLSGAQTIAATTGTAAAGDVLATKTFNSANGIGLTGSMPNQGAKVITPGTANQAIPAGYHNGSGYVVGDADFIAENIPSDMNFFGLQGTRSLGRKFASGTATANAGNVTVWRGYDGGAGNSPTPTVLVTGLAFKPSLIVMKSYGNTSMTLIAWPSLMTYVQINRDYAGGSSYRQEFAYATDLVYIINGSFRLPGENSAWTWTWWAYE